MSKHDFPWEEFQERRARVREEMARRELDWLILIHPVSLHWLTGADTKSYQEFQCLFFSQQEEAITVLTREGECAEFQQDAWVDHILGWGGREIEDPMAHFTRAADYLGLKNGRVGLEVPAYYLHPHDYIRIRDWLGETLTQECSALVHNLKLVKSGQELTYIRKAAALADGAMERFSQSLEPGLTELHLAGEVYHFLFQAGSGIAASPINLVSGERSCFSHGAPSLRRIQPGDFGSIEFGATYHRYTATLGRQFCVGTPTPRMKELHAIVREAADACIAEIRAGVPASGPHAAAKRVIGKAGLEAGRVHTTGYGLAPGFPPTWGEPLHLLEGSHYTLEAGMVLTVEPPIFLSEERLGARLIDNVVVTETGAELLSRFSRELLQTQNS